jgi:flagellar hook-basal body complex protein FliE
MADSFSVISSSAARGAYSASQTLQSGKASPAEESQESGKASFAALVEKAASESVQTMRQADAVAQAGLAGNATTQQVVEATMALESTVKMAVTMRDKLVTAYQEVLRMPI